MNADYRDLIVWQRARALVKDVYSSTRSFPRDEIFGLTSQMRRAAVSIPSNIAEGKGRYSRKELVQFLFKSRGSLLELETQVQLARDLGSLDEQTQERLSAQILAIKRPLNGLINRFQEKSQAA